MMPLHALKILTHELGQEIRWMERHPRYFRNGSCHNHMILRLRDKLADITGRIEKECIEQTDPDPMRFLKPKQEFTNQWSALAGGGFKE